MLIVEGHGWPIGDGVFAANHHEAAIAESALASLLWLPKPENLLGDTAYSSGPLTRRLWQRFAIHLTAPPKRHYVNYFHDGRRLKRRKRRWKIERTLSWVKTYRRLETRWERKAMNFLGLVHLACVMQLISHAF